MEVVFYSNSFCLLCEHDFWEYMIIDYGFWLYDMMIEFKKREKRESDWI